MSWLSGARGGPKPPIAARGSRCGEYAFRGFAFYERSQAALERLAFTVLGDFELDQVAWVLPGFRTFARVMVSADRQVVCTIIDATPHPIGTSGFLRLRLRLSGVYRQHLAGISLRTELSDGRFLITSTDTDFVKEEVPRDVLRETLPRETSAPELLARHRASVVEAIGPARATVVAIENVEDFGRSLVRHQRKVRAFREAVGFAFTEREQRDFVESASPLDRGMGDSTLEAMRELENEGKKRAG